LLSTGPTAYLNIDCCLLSTGPIALRILRVLLCFQSILVLLNFFDFIDLFSVLS
jgi:hypothetical protein